MVNQQNQKIRNVQRKSGERKRKGKGKEKENKAEKLWKK